MYMLHSWKSSLNLFKPSNLKLFFLALIKLVTTQYMKYLKYAAIPIVCLFTMKYTAFGTSFKGTRIGFLLISQMQAILSFICVIVAVLLMRPSVEKKDRAYVVSYMRYYLSSWIALFFIWIFISTLISFIFFEVLLWMNPAEMMTTIIRKNILWYWLYVMSIFNGMYLMLTLFFFTQLEAKLVNVVRSYWLALKFMVYNVPFFIALGLLMFVLSSCIKVIYTGSYQLLLPIYCAMMSLYYTKKIHEQSFLYMENHNE